MRSWLRRQPACFAHFDLNICQLQILGGKYERSRTGQLARVVLVAEAEDGDWGLVPLPPTEAHTHLLPFPLGWFLSFILCGCFLCFWGWLFINIVSLHPPSHRGPHPLAIIPSRLVFRKLFLLAPQYIDCSSCWGPLPISHKPNCTKTKTKTQKHRNLGMIGNPAQQSEAPTHYHTDPPPTLP